MPYSFKIVPSVKKINWKVGDGVPSEYWLAFNVDDEPDLYWLEDTWIEDNPWVDVCLPNQPDFECEFIGEIKIDPKFYEKNGFFLFRKGYEKELYPIYMFE